MKIGIIGYGNVGRAVYNGLIQYHDVWVSDIKPLENIKNYPSWVLARTCDAIFICVPTPKGPSGHAELKYVYQSIASLNADTCKGLIIIKSTVPPGTTDLLRDTYNNLRFACNPDFLRENYAVEDFIAPDRIVYGAYTVADTQVLDRIYNKWNCKKIVCSPVEAELIKHLSNACLTMKVAFACEVAKISKLYQASPAIVSLGVSSDKRIGSSHLNPILGKIKWSSPCLPKDLTALIKALETQEYESKFLKSILDNGVEKTNE